MRIFNIASILVFLSVSIILLPAKPCIAEGTPAVGDRLIVSINSTPYSQRQAETYLVIKESLREDFKDSSLVFSATNWFAILSAYSDEMIIHQEAHRVGSFQPSEAALKIAVSKFAERAKSSPSIAAEEKRLGIDERTLLRTLHTVLRTEAFRRNKERISVVARTEDDGATRWFEEIKERAIVRYYAGAEKYLEILPAQQSQK